MGGVVPGQKRMLSPSQKLESRLVNSGWYPRRHVDATHIERRLSRRGYLVHSAAREVLCEFSDLTLEPERRPNWIIDDDPRIVIFGGSTRPRWPTRYSLLRRLTGSKSLDAYFFERYLQLNVCLVGQRLLRIDSNQWYCLDWLYIAEDGRAFSCSEKWEVVIIAAGFMSLLELYAGTGKVECDEIVVDCEDANKMLAELGIKD